MREVQRRQAMPRAVLKRFGVAVPSPLPAELREVGPMLVHADGLAGWTADLKRRVAAHATANPLSPGLPRGAAMTALALPDAVLLPGIVRAAGLEERDGVIRDPRSASGLGAAEAGIAALEARLRATPFAAPEADDLSALRLGARELAAAERLGRIIRLSDGVVLLPSAPALAMRELARLPQPFTTSQARQALGTTRRVAIPLLEHLDARGWTRRLDGTSREVVR